MSCAYLVLNRVAARCKKQGTKRFMPRPILASTILAVLALKSRCEECSFNKSSHRCGLTSTCPDRKQNPSATQSESQSCTKVVTWRLQGAEKMVGSGSCWSSRFRCSCRLRIPVVPNIFKLLFSTLSEQNCNLRTSRVISRLHYS